MIINVLLRKILPCTLLLAAVIPSISHAQNNLVTDSIVTPGFTEHPAGYRSPFTVSEGPNTRKYLTGVSLGGLFLGTLIDSYYKWWQVRENGFRFHDDGWFGKNFTGLDKPGHLFASYFYFHSYYDLLRWGGFDHGTSFWWSAGTTYALALLIEVGDGLTTLGFDYQDLIFNTLGLSLAMLQKELPFLNNFRIKASYVPYDGYDVPPRFSEHYDALTFWLAFDVNNLLPDNLEPYWPDPLQLAVGYSVVNHYTPQHRAAGNPELVFGLDFDLGVFSVKQPELHLLQRMVNHYHFPMPAVKFTNGEPATWKLFYLQ